MVSSKEVKNNIDLIFAYTFTYYGSKDVWMPYGSLSSQPGASNVTQAALRLTTL